jgi:hypothetical protein
MRLSKDTSVRLVVPFLTISRRIILTFPLCSLWLTYLAAYATIHEATTRNVVSLAVMSLVSAVFLFGTYIWQTSHVIFFDDGFMIGDGWNMYDRRGRRFARYEDIRRIDVSRIWISLRGYQISVYG